MEKPLICTLNLSSIVNEKLTENGFNIFPGTFGNQIETFNKEYYDYKLCLLNPKFPKNIEEYEVFIFDLTNSHIDPYIRFEHERIINKHGHNSYFLNLYPQTIFDPRPCGLSMLFDRLNLNKKLTIVFCSENEKVEYRLVNKTNSSYTNVSIDVYSTYDHFPVQIRQNKYGTETIVSNNAKGDLKQLLDKYNSNFKYHITFNQSQHYTNQGLEDDPQFIPLVTNKSGEIVSFIKLDDENGGIFFFPDIEDKYGFLKDFLNETAPSLFPEIFPESEGNKWINNKSYFLPNQEQLLLEKEQVHKEYSSKIKLKEAELRKNTNQFSFLHDLITKTDAELVTSVITFLRWLGFDKIKDMDQEDSQKNEDIQIENDKGLLIIEVKGLGGTSKDSDCAQIVKHKYRRSEERGKFDVSALYIVNHQRHLPPLSRQNPPFTFNQIMDATNDKRGLISTWELFKLYKNIEIGIISKEEARERIYDFGLINFYKSLDSLGKPKEILKNGEVFVIDAKQEIKVGDILYFKEDENYCKATITSIQINGKNVEVAKNIEVGIKTSHIVKNRTEIFLKRYSV